MANRFRTPMMRAAYDGAQRAYRIRHRDLFLSNGSRRTVSTYGSSFATAFWHGYDGTNADRQDRQTLAYAIWRAGRDIASKPETPEE